MPDAIGFCAITVHFIVSPVAGCSKQGSYTDCTTLPKRLRCRSLLLLQMGSAMYKRHIVARSLQVVICSFPFQKAVCWHFY